MDGIDLLRAQALQKRNAAIAAARRQYAADLKEITALKNKLGLKPVGRPRKYIASDYAGLQATTVAREVLLEGKPMTMVELTLEVQRRGCRPLDRPRDVAHAIRSGLKYHRRQFKRDQAGRWSIL
jgi:hypothetical protein